ncbi:MAG: hypothetical protein EOO90_23640 [Pedobacter sp.]|nr:MAG: hypothetical protein EOO90_23640 [Pedobacter sp.]
MSKEKEINEIERIKSVLEYHFQKYKDYKYDSKVSSRKKDRDRATDKMITHANYLQQQLYNPLILSAILSGNQFQFEHFWKYVESDMPGYLMKIDSLLESLKSTENDI